MTAVLVVDDERLFADTLAERLRTRGLAVTAVYDGGSAVAEVQHRRPDVVLLDLSMPGMDGLTTLEAIKQLTPDTTVVLLTAESGLATAVDGMKRGAADYIVKPAPLERILRAIHDAKAQHLDAAKRHRMAETARLAALGELAVGVAHEINNPLQIVLNEAGWLAELLADAELPEATRSELAGSLSTIAEQTARCKAVTAKLLALRDAVPPDDTRRPLAAVAQDVLREQGPRWEGRIEVVTDIPDAILVPASTWTRILQPLVDNALDALNATPHGSAGGARRLTVRASIERDQTLVLRVEDTGAGIEPAILQRIFEPFFSTKEVGRGMGLGLSLCRALVEALGGHIEVHSIPGNGTIVTVTAPYHEPNTPEKPAIAKEVSHE